MTLLVLKGAGKETKGGRMEEIQAGFWAQIKKWDVFYSDSNKSEKLRDWLYGLEFSFAHVERIK